MTFSLRRMLYEDRYKLILAACQDIRRHREQVAKTVIASQLLDALDVDVPSDALLSHIVAESLLRRIDRNLLSGRNLYLQAEKRPQIDLFTLLQRAIPAVPQGYALANQYLVHAMRPVEHAGAAPRSGSARACRSSRCCGRSRATPARSSASA